MASEIFNSISGYSVGIPPVAVVDANGNVVTNVLTTGNVTAGVIYSSDYRFANGSPLTLGAAGSNTEVQFNIDGDFGASSSFTFNSTTDLLSIVNLLTTGIVNLGDVSNLKILGGVDGYFLQTDGTGNLAWSEAGGGGNGHPGGSNTQVQYNDNGTFGGTVGFTFNETTNTVTAEHFVATTFSGLLYGIANNALTVTANSQPNITSVGTLGNLIVAGNVVANQFVGNATGLSNIPAANLIGSIPLAAHVSENAQPNITSLGTLTGLIVNGNIGATNINADANISAGNINVTRGIYTKTADITGNLIVGETPFALGNLFAANTTRVELGNVANVHILGGSPGYVLSTDGLGNLSWASGGGGNGGSPGGNNRAIQFNDLGHFGGSDYFVFDDATNTLTLAGDMVANTYQIGAGIHKFSTQLVYFATTNNTSANQLLWSIPASQISAIDFTIISTDDTANTRQFVKISAMLFQEQVVYNEYAGLHINGGTGSFSVDYDPGGILNPPSVRLLVTPDSSSLTKYNMMITEYAA